MSDTPNVSVEVESVVPVKVPEKIAKEAADKMKRQAERTRRNAIANAENYSKFAVEQMEKARKADEDAEADAKAWAEAMTILKAAGFKPSGREYPFWEVAVQVSEKQLPKLARAIGRLDVDNAEKEICNAEDGTIWIEAKAVKYPNVAVKWKHKLTKDDRCQIVEEVIPQKTETRLQCNVNS